MLLPDRITLVLRAPEGAALEQVLPFALLGAHVSIGRGLAVIAGASLGDLQAEWEEKAQELGREREEHGHAMEYCERALGMHPLLAAHAREMHDLLRLINVKVGGLRAVCDHGGDPSEQMWEEFDAALDAIWPLLEVLEPTMTQERDPAAGGFNIDEHIRMAADARRYRWLRDHTDSSRDPKVSVTRWTQVSAVEANGTPIAGEDLDREIDAALLFLAQEKQP
ncbi:hypothetical protein I5P84_05925 [Pseudomonas mosselii]|uniref:hypothetical protein n=1 Tax=Pseudomonas mosselii TaxID=78327 RepID=UPI0018D69515|nr:hypothetical protein [Pseudomonas mosselii]MBH3308991.1 hypothetical protein [Pseudomonas mosselii]MBH3324016.1 hypothetical protein [Pseudomonas mosselii]